MRVRRFREQNGEKPYDTCKFRTLIRRLRRHLPHLGEGFKMRRLSFDLLSFVRKLNHNLSTRKNRRGLDRRVKMWYSNNINKNCDGKSNRKETEREWEPWLEVPVGRCTAKTTPELTAMSSSVSPRKGRAKAMSEKPRWNRAHAPLRRMSRVFFLFFEYDYR